MAGIGKQLRGSGVARPGLWANINRRKKQELVVQNLNQLNQLKHMLI